MSGHCDNTASAKAPRQTPTSANVRTLRLAMTAVHRSNREAPGTRRSDTVGEGIRLADRSGAGVTRSQNCQPTVAERHDEARRGPAVATERDVRPAGVAAGLR